MSSLRFVCLLLCFALSGLAALVYQTAWSEELALVFGAAQPAVAAVLAATMAGLALGATVAGRFESRLARPLLAYALLELGVGLVALAIPTAVRGVGTVQRLLLAGHAEDEALATLFAVAAALLLLLVPNALMGATLPLVARRAVRSAAELGPRVAALYAANTAGAAAGAVLCAFFFIPRLGLGGATYAAAAVSLTASLLAFLLARGTLLAPGRRPPAAAVSLGVNAWVLPAMLASGAVSFAYEVTWTRLLGHLLGGSSFAFGTMLATFLVGLAIGSAVAARWAGARDTARRAFAAAELVTAASMLLAFAALDRLPGLLETLAADGAGVRPVSALAGAALMLPGAMAIGMTFPLAVRILGACQEDRERRFAGVVGPASRRVLGPYHQLEPSNRLQGDLGRSSELHHPGQSDRRLVHPATLEGGLRPPLHPPRPRFAIATHATGGLGRATQARERLGAPGASPHVRPGLRASDDAGAGLASARVLAWNTVGSIVGALATGFVLLPTLGFAGVVTLGVAVNLGLAGLAAGVSRPRLRLAGGLALGLAAVLALAPPAPPWQVLRSSPIAAGIADGEVAFFAVGRSATVLAVDAGREWRLSTDGLPEAAILAPGARPGRQPITSWLSLLPLAARPTTASMLVIGLGGGSTLEEIPETVAEITVVELEREVVAANRCLAARRRWDPLADPRVRVVVNDARTYLRLTDRRYEVIVSQPSHPWTAGASHLFTREMFELVRDRLEPHGVLAQWVGLNLVDADTFRSLLATLGAVFPYVETYCPYPGTAALFLASAAPIALDGTAAAEAVATVPLWRDLGVLSGDDLLLARVLDRAGSARLAHGALHNTDRHNLLGTRSPRLVRRPLTSSLAEIERAWGPLDPLPHTVGVDRLYVTARLLELGSPARALRTAAAIDDRVARETAFALAALARGDSRRGLQELERLAHAESAAAAPVRALVRWRQRELGNAPPTSALLALSSADPAIMAVVEAWRRLAAGDLAGVAELDDRLGAVHPRDLLYPAAVRLRVSWRQAAGEPGPARAALALLDPLLAPRAQVPDLLLRARLGRAAGDGDVVLASLAEVASAALGRAALGAAAQSGLAILDEPGAAPSANGTMGVRRLLERATHPDP